MSSPAPGIEPCAARTQAWLDLAALLNPGGHRADPRAQARPMDWHRIYALAAGQCVAPSLHQALAQSPLGWGGVPAEVQQALAELCRLNQARNKLFRQVLRRTVQCLNAAGIEPFLLKGSIALLPGQYPHAGARMLGDLDIALHSGQAERADQVLRAAGYGDVQSANDPKLYDRAHHMAPLHDPSGRVSIELHHEVLHPTVHPQALPLALMRRDALPIDWDGLRLWVPSLHHRMLHNALHEAVQDKGFRSGSRSLRQLLEFAHLLQQPGAAMLDWVPLLARLDALHLGQAVRAQVLVCGQLFGQPLPYGVVPGPSAQRSARRFWFWTRRPGLWPYYKAARRVGGLALNALTPHWYPSKWRQLRKMWQLAQSRRQGATAQRLAK